MRSLKKQICESFFNPILYFLPTLVFIAADDFWGINNAWKISFPVAFALVFYVYFMYRRMFFGTACLRPATWCCHYIHRGFRNFARIRLYR